MNATLLPWSVRVDYLPRVPLLSLPGDRAPLTLRSEPIHVEAPDRATAATMAHAFLRERCGPRIGIVDTVARIRCIVDPNRDGPTLWDCACAECRALQREAE